ncbi:MAG: ABC transporter ATP-binding protein [Bacteroidetes bacterium]|nr:ABC transporter ATP-binding protein [Bacteroidota bacterium]
MKELIYLNKFLWKYKWRLILGIIFVVVSNVFGLFPPKILGISVDIIKDNVYWFKLYKGSAMQERYFFLFNALLLVLSVFVLFMALIRGAFMFMMRQTIIVMSRLIEYDLKNELYEHYQMLHSGFYKSNNTGDMMSRVTEDVSRVRMYIGPALMYSINLTALFILVISTMFRVNPYLSFIVLLPLPLLSFSIYKVSSVINRKSEIIQRKLSGLTTMAQEVFSGIRVVKSYVREPSYADNFDEAATDYKGSSLELAKIEAFFAPLMLLLIGLSTILTVYIGGIEVARGRFTAGNIAEFVFYINMLTWPVASLGWVASLVQRAAASQKRINEFLQTEPQIQNTTANPVGKVESVEFRNVEYTYDNTGITALKNVSFKMSSGEKYAIVGKTGSGKSTIAELLLRSFDTTSGSININGENIESFDVFELRRETGYIPQDVFLFSDDVTNNIRFGNAAATIDEVQKAAEMAEIHNDISGLKEGYDTVVGERGVTLSGGQKQRISIARALVKNPQFMILDDCLSAVDATTEHRILKNFESAFENRTVLFITHRIFSLMQFDNILVLDEGVIKESGSHKELLDRKGLYWEMYQLQQQERSSRTPETA